MLKECERTPGVTKAEEYCRKKIAFLRPTSALVDGLTHPSPDMNRLTLTEIKEFGIDHSTVAEAIVERFSILSNYPWYEVEATLLL